MVETGTGWVNRIIHKELYQETLTLAAIKKQADQVLLRLLPFIERKV